MAEEKPTLDESEKKPEEGQPTPEDEAKALLSELEGLGIENPEQIQGMAKASSEAGNLGNLLGEVRRENQELRDMIQKQVNTPKDEFETPSIDLKGEFKTAAREVMQEMTNAQKKSQQMAWQEYANIQGDEDFQVVKEVWDKHVASPQIQMAIGNGQTTMTAEYNKLVRGFYRKIAQRSKDVITKLDKVGAIVPHTETTQPHPPKIEVDDEKKQKIKKIVDESTGSSEDLDKLLDQLLPSDDPFFNT